MSTQTFAASNAGYQLRMSFAHRLSISICLIRWTSPPMPYANGYHSTTKITQLVLHNNAVIDLPPLSHKMKMLLNEKRPNIITDTYTLPFIDIYGKIIMILSRLKPFWLCQATLWTLDICVFVCPSHFSGQCRIEFWLKFHSIIYREKQLFSYC